MRRRLLTILIFLLLGAVVNVGVAWGCAAWVRLGPAERTAVGWSDDPNLPGERGWKLRRYDAFGATRVVAMVRMSRGSGDPEVPPEDVVPGWSALIEAASRQSAGARAGRDVHPSVMYEDARGWPMLTLRCGWDHGVAASQLSGGIALPPVVPNAPGEVNILNQRALPLSPYWPGLAVDTLLYAAILWLLICGPFVLRRFIRVRRGLCPACSYPVADSPVCTECGRELPKRARVAT